jgi:hypothetical protein
MDRVQTASAIIKLKTKKESKGDGKDRLSTLYSVKLVNNFILLEKETPANSYFKLS